MIKVSVYIDSMENERQGWGPTAMEAVNDTARSWVRGLGILLDAEEVWADGPGLSLGGRLKGGIVFGMIARRDIADTLFEHQPVEWTFHS
jgi:hypothetical protein